MNSKFQCFLKDMYDDIQISKNAKNMILIVMCFYGIVFMYLLLLGLHGNTDFYR